MSLFYSSVVPHGAEDSELSDAESDTVMSARWVPPPPVPRRVAALVSVAEVATALLGGCLLAALLAGEALGPLDLGGGILCLVGAGLSHLLSRAGFVERGVALAYGAWALAVASAAVSTGYDVGAHLLLVPLPPALLATFSGPPARRWLAAAAATALFAGFEVADLAGSADVAHPDAARRAVRAALMALVAAASAAAFHGDGDGSLRAGRRRSTGGGARSKLRHRPTGSIEQLTFLTMVSHRIRTPLNAVIAFSDMLCTALQNSEVQDMAETVASSSQLLLTVINDLLDLSRVDAGHLTLSPTLVDLDSIIDVVVGAEFGEAQRKGLALCADVQLPLPFRVEVDAKRLRQVLTNLVGNALKFTEYGHVLMTVQQLPSGEVEFAVTDTGRGISAANLASLFEPYAASSGADDQLAQGQGGLGLAISAKIAKLMNGDLTVQSAVGRGSTFTLRLPLVVKEAPQLAWRGTAAIECENPLVQATIRDATARLGGVVVGVGSSEADVMLVSDPRSAMGWSAARARTVLVVPPGQGQGLGYPLLTLPLRRTELHALLSAAGEDAASERRSRSQHGATDEEDKGDDGDGQQPPDDEPMPTGDDGDLEQGFAPAAPVPWAPPEPIIVGSGSEAGGSTVPSTPVHGPTPPTTAELPVLDHIDVLVAEDNPINRKVVAHMLKRLRCTHRMAVNGADCVEQFKERRPNVVLMDCHMPVMDGFEATRAIREIDATVPVVALTADAFDSTRDAAVQSGMSEVLTKPIIIVELAAALDRQRQRAAGPVKLTPLAVSRQREFRRSTST